MEGMNMNNKTVVLSASKIRAYKNCQQRYWFKYIEGIEEDVKADALIEGSNYHKNLEQHLTGEIVENHTYLSKAFLEHVDTSNWKVIAIEKKFKIKIAHGIYIEGIVDGIVEIDGEKYLLEHKTTSKTLDEAYVDELRWDDQIPIYCFATGIYKVLYTSIKKNTLRQKDQTEEEWFKERVDWYNKDTESKIRVDTFRRMKEDVKDCKEKLIDLAKEIRGRKTFHRNRDACMRPGKCPYRDICFDYKPETIVGFVKNKYATND